MAGLNPTATFKIALPWLLSALGLEKQLRERWIRCPEAHLQDAVNDANNSLPVAQQITPAQWRAVEATQAKILSQGIIAQATPR